MKKLTLFLFIAVLLAGSIYAQGRNIPQRENNLVTVNGTLKLERGFVAVQSENANDSSVVVVPMLNRFIGFINGLREGAEVSVEGIRHRNMIRPVKVILDGRTYDFPVMDNPPALRNQGNEQRFNNPGQRRNNPRNNPGQNRNAPSRGNNQCGCCVRTTR